MELDRITIPTMIVANQNDGCSITPPSGAQPIAGEPINFDSVVVKIFNGGDTPESKPCQAMSYHGFLGIEHDVVGAITNFIKAN